MAAFRGLANIEREKVQPLIDLLLSDYQIAPLVREELAMALGKGNRAGLKLRFSGAGNKRTYREEHEDLARMFYIGDWIERKIGEQTKWEDACVDAGEKFGFSEVTAKRIHSKFRRERDTFLSRNDDFESWSKYVADMKKMTPMR